MKENAVETALKNLEALVSEYDAYVVRQQESLCWCCLERPQEGRLLILNFAVVVEGHKHPMIAVFTCERCKNAMAANTCAEQCLTHVIASQRKVA